MDTLVIALVSIVLLAVLTAVLRTTTPLRFCPICVGVSGTWLWMLIMRQWDLAIDPVVLALLLGGSVVGIAYWLNRQALVSRGSLFMALFVPIGFITAYGAVTERWVLTVIAAALATGIAVTFRWRHGDRQAVRQDIIAEAEKKLEQCCE